MRGINDINLRSVDGMGLTEVIEWLISLGYTPEALSNDEIYNLANAILDGHADGPDEPEELDFSDG